MNIKKYLVEFIGTFFLVLTVGCTLLSKAPGVIPPLAIGSALMVMVFAGGHISGGHYNPAVTLAVWIRGKCPTFDVPFYMVAQLIGAAMAASIAILITHKDIVLAYPIPIDVHQIAGALIAEFLFTFALAYVVCNVATAKGTANNSFYGLAIGFTVVTGAFAVGDISGGAFNPAVAIGASIMGLINWESVWIHLLADFAGGALAGVTFIFLNPDDK
jgi:aquaporin Z